MRAQGFSLIELMMALAIGSFLIAGAVTVYVRSSATYAISETIARLQETARFALSTLEPDVRLAGFWGLTSDAVRIKGAIGNVPIALSSRGARCGAEFPLNLRHPLEGTNNAYALPCPASGGGVQAGTDVLIVRHADTDAVSASAERLQVYTTRAGGADTVFLSDSAPGPVGTDPVFGPGAEMHDLLANAYYIARNSIGQPDLPALRRKTLQGGAATGPNIGDEEVMAGVEDLQVQFGIDPGADDNSDGVPDDADADARPDRYNGTVARYVNPGDPALAGAVVIAARIWIRVRAESPEAGYTDNKTYNYADVTFRPVGADAARRRLLVSRTIQLRDAPGLRP